MEPKPSPLIIVITGATSGIGLAAARQLVQHGDWVIGIGRSAERCREQQDTLDAEAPAGARVRFLPADLSLQSEVRRAADDTGAIIQQWEADHLDALINNAATVPFWQTLTPEGFDLQWAVNHLAPFLLTDRLLPLLKRAAWARVVTVSSGSHYGARLNWEDIQLRRHYNALRAYGQTKLANVLFTAELDRRLRKDTSVRAFAADPGLVNTELGLKSNSFIARWAWDIRRRGGMTPEESARGVAFLATDPSIQDADELYWKHGRAKAPNPYGLNREAAEQLWKLSAQMCGLPS